MPPTPPSSHGSDSEGSQSPVHAPPGLSCPTSPTSPAPAPPALKTSPRASSCLSNSPLLTAPHVRTRCQCSGNLSGCPRRRIHGTSPSPRQKLQGSGPLMLTEEERRTLVAEGYPVPTKLPLTKAEEKALKKIRRKIKNKVALQKNTFFCVFLDYIHIQKNRPLLPDFSSRESQEEEGVHGHSGEEVSCRV